MPDEHAKRLQPSSMPALMLCPGFRGSSEETPASIDGTRQHALAAWRWTHPDDPWPTQVDDWQITSEDVGLVSAVEPWVREKLTPPQVGPHQYWIEQKVEIGKWCGLPEGELWGTLDLGVVDKDTLTVADLKFGRMPVSPDSWQLKSYAVGLGVELVDPNNPGSFLPQYRQVRNIDLVILQPRESPEPKVVRFPLDKIAEWAKALKWTGLQVLEGNAPRVPGDTQCKWCANAGDCRERQQWVTQKMQSAMTLTDQPVPLVTSDASDAPAPIASVDVITDIAEVKMAQDPEDLSQEEIGKILDQASLIEGWLKDVRKLAQRKLEAGLTIPGWKMIAGRRAKAWNETEENAIVAGLTKIGLFKKDIYRQTLSTPNQIMDLDKVQKHKAKREKAEALWHWKEGRPVLAPESDPSPGIDDAHKMFKPVETETDNPDPWG